MARTLEQKICTRCSSVKPVADFYPQGKYFRSECKLCSREKGKGAYARTSPEVKARWNRVRRAKTYGLTLEEYDELVSRVTACEICGTDNPGPQDWHIDHDHRTGKVRSILCHNCNLGLGHFQDDPARLRAAADYLEAHSATES